MAWPRGSHQLGDDCSSEADGSGFHVGAKQTVTCVACRSSLRDLAGELWSARPKGGRTGSLHETALLVESLDPPGDDPIGFGIDHMWQRYMLSPSDHELSC